MPFLFLFIVRWARMTDSESVRTQLHFKVELEHDRDEDPRRVAAEICRQIQKVYGVRSAELTSFHTE
jgi:hypothetical protein